jgi:hypothetical protein
MVFMIFAAPFFMNLAVFMNLLIPANLRVAHPAGELAKGGLWPR